MKLKELSTIDPSLKEYHVKNSDIDVTNITDSFETKSDSILFLKNKQFHQEFLAKKNAADLFLIIIESKFLEKMTPEEIEDLKKCSHAILEVKDVNISMSKLSKPFFDIKFSHLNLYVDGRQMGNASIHPESYIAQNVFIGENVKVGARSKIYPGCVLMSGAEIGEDCEIFPNVSIYYNVKIGNKVRIHAGCTIGSDGFGYNFFDGAHGKVWHTGGVIIDDMVEIGANSCVDAGTFSPTRIGFGCKLDNLVQVGHNSLLGKHVVLCGHVAIAGSATLHDYVVVGGKSAVGNNLDIGTGAQIAAFSGVINNVEAKQTVGGYPARDYKEWLKGLATLRKISLSKGKE